MTHTPTTALRRSRARLTIGTLALGVALVVGVKLAQGPSTRISAPPAAEPRFPALDERAADAPQSALGAMPGATARGDRSELRATALPLTLNGVVLAENPNASIAIISVSDGPQGAYRVGAAIAGVDDVTLYSIEPAQVVLEHGGDFETLRSSLRSLPDTAAANQAEPRKPDPLIENTRRLAGVVKVSAVSGQRGESGFRLSPAAESAPFEALGLRSGDVLIAVDGMPIDAGADQEAVLRALLRAPSVRISLVRDGSAVDADVNIGYIIDAHRDHY